MTIEDIRDLDNKIHEIIESNFHNAMGILPKYGFNKVGKALFMFITKTNFIKCSLFDICENEDIYSANILLRSLFDHHLKFMYIFKRFYREKTDEVGIEYYHYCDFSESFMSGKAWLESWEIRNPENEEKLYEIIIKGKPELKGISKSEIIQKTKQFNYKNIVEFLKQSEKTEKLEYGWLDKIIPYYGDLSSYVHGGPLADKYLVYFNNEIERNKKLLEISKWAFLTANTLKQFLYLILAQIDKGHYSDSLEKLNQIISEFYKMDN